jgi:hypothetical protein
MKRACVDGQVHKGISDASGEGRDSVTDVSTEEHESSALGCVSVLHTP